MSHRSSLAAECSATQPRIILSQLSERQIQHPNREISVSSVRIHASRPRAGSTAKSPSCPPLLTVNSRTPPLRLWTKTDLPCAGAIYFVFYNFVRVHTTLR